MLHWAKGSVPLYLCPKRAGHRPPPSLSFQHQHLDHRCSPSCKGLLLWLQVTAQPSAAAVHVSGLVSPAKGFTGVTLSLVLLGLPLAPCGQGCAHQQGRRAEGCSWVMFPLLPLCTVLLSAADKSISTGCPREGPWAQRCVHKHLITKLGISFS